MGRARKLVVLLAVLVVAAAMSLGAFLAGSRGARRSSVKVGDCVNVGAGQLLQVVPCSQPHTNRVVDSTVNGAGSCTSPSGKTFDSIVIHATAGAAFCLGDG
jgi:hypothetical protein